MTVLPARDTLTIFVDGDEVPGVIAYGLRYPRSQPLTNFPSAVWKAQPEPTTFTLHGDGWEVVMWEVPLIIWPTATEMERTLSATLGNLIQAGCRVAWIGAEGLPFCDPPELFDPRCMSGSVLAWMADTVEQDCHLDPDAPLASVSDDVLLSLRAHSRGLADVS